MTDQKSLFVIFDGIDGSGKNTIAKAFIKGLVSTGRSSFDLIAWMNKYNALPSIDECVNADIIFTTEPSHTWIGAAIRQELIREGSRYSSQTIAEAFALDRLVLYERLIIPLLNLGKTIVQERGVSSSLVYQTGQRDGYSVREIMELRGNSLALAYPPTHIVIADCDPARAIQRLGARTQKQDQAIFEKLEILERLRNRFHTTWFRDIWTSRKTKLHYLDTNPPIDEVRESAKALALELAKTQFAGAR